MKVGIFIDSVEAKGGQVRVVANLCHGWINAGWEVHLITNARGDCSFPLPDLVKRHNLLDHPRRNGLMRVWDNVRTVIQLGRLSRSVKFDGIIAISAVESIQLAMARCPSCTTKLGSEHGYARHYPMPWFLGFCRRFFYPRLNGVVCPARQSAEALREDCPGTDAINIPNLLIWPSAQASRSAVPLFDPRRRRFVTCGRLVHDKGFDIIIESFSRIAHDCPAWDLVIVGEGPEADALKALANSKKLDERVHFTGYSDGAHLIYDACDVFVYASPQEGFGMVIAEAQASGLPAICTDCLAGPSDIVSDNRSGCLIPVGAVDEFSHAMKRLALDDEVRTQMSSQAVLVIDRFSEDAITPRWSDAFRGRTN